jgi:putative DNA primase/helicase
MVASRPPAACDKSTRIARALDLWREANDPRGTLAETYLASRALVLGPELAGDVIRFHGACPWLDKVTNRIVRLPAMLALMRQVEGNRPMAVQRTALTPDGRKIERRMLGIAGGAAIKLDEDAAVTVSLTVGEGLETCMSARQLSFRPAWALGSVAAVATFPVLSGIEVLHLLQETGDYGASARAVQACGSRWDAAGPEVIVVTPQGCEGDANDVLRRKVG